MCIYTRALSLKADPKDSHCGPFNEKSVRLSSRFFTFWTMGVAFCCCHIPGGARWNWRTGSGDAFAACCFLYTIRGRESRSDVFILLRSLWHPSPRLFSDEAVGILISWKKCVIFSAYFDPYRDERKDRVTVASDNGGIHGCCGSNGCLSVIFFYIMLCGEDYLFLVVATNILND